MKAAPTRTRRCLWRRASQRGAERVVGTRDWSVAAVVVVGVLTLAVAVSSASAAQPLPRAEKAAPVEQPKPTVEKPASPATQPGAAQAPVDDGAVYKVARFILMYGRDHTGQPPLEPFMQVPMTLGETSGGFVAPRLGVPTVEIQLRHFQTEQRIYASAIRSICEQLVREFARRGHIGIIVETHAKDIDPKTGNDLRSTKAGPLRLVIWTSVVTMVRTIASGQRVPADQRIDNPVHAPLKDRSPVKPYDPDAGPRRDLLRKDLLDDYVFYLNRHPGRRVDVGVASAGKPGEVSLDFLVTENKPWFAYFQVSNTGTERTNEWRERFGFVHNQLTNRDDTLTVDYITGGFDESHSVLLSYETPIPGIELPNFTGQTRPVRFRASFSYGEYDASEIGFAEEDFHGEEWAVGGDFIFSLAQIRNLFIDGLLGMRWRHVKVENESFDVEGEEDFLWARAGLRVEYVTDATTTLGYIDIERALPGLTAVDEDELLRLGRLGVDKNWTVMHYEASHAFYLEPLLFPEGWKDANSTKATLAHEIYLSVKGQVSFGDRLIPQEEYVAGGLYTVRGYEESVVAGDTAVVGTAEYRLHVPRLFKPQPKPGKLPILNTPFRWAPQQPYGRPDWDLILKAFFDVGYVHQADRLVEIEKNESLSSVGIGAELQFSQHFNVRVDVGWALEEVGDPAGSAHVDSGDARVHFVGTILY